MTQDLYIRNSSGCRFSGFIFCPKKGIYIATTKVDIREKLRDNKNYANTNTLTLTSISVYPKGKMSLFVLFLSPLFNSGARPRGTLKGLSLDSSKRNLRQFHSKTLSTSMPADERPDLT